jgi:hypothetical protein
MGVLPTDCGCFDRLSGAELLLYVGLLRRVPPAEIATSLCRAARCARADRRSRHARRGVLGRYDEEDRTCLLRLIHAPGC